MPRPMSLRPAATVAMLAALAFAPFTAPADAQDGAIPRAETLVRVATPTRSGRAGETVRVVVRFEVEHGWHINANPPSSEEMIPTVVTLTDAPELDARDARYPAGRREKLSFSEEELLVYDGQVAVEVLVVIAAHATATSHHLQGTLRYQACNDQVCLPPTTLPFDVVINVGAAGATEAVVTDTASSAVPPGSGADSTPDTPTPPSAGFTTGPPPAGSASGRASVLDNPIAQLFARGGFVAFLSLFLIGLALNLTPCVYPMMGVTVSIFGSRKSASPLHAFMLAAVYVLGMAVMYSALGVVAALTGTLFGGFLQSPLVLLGIGILLALLALSMFGLYEFQLPASLLSRLGGSGASSVMGIFLSGLVVGVFAAPCTGPPVVALLALVGAKGDPVFGFLAFFVLALGLGLPYLVLGTFSNLLQRMPRSGTWMVWVKKVFGTIMLAVGLFYVMLSAAPGWAEWVLPVALLGGGVYLGFLEHSMRTAGARRLQWLFGALAIVAGVVVVMGNSKRGVEFAEFEPAAMHASLASGQPVMLDFSADWCNPCRELDKFTFTDRDVIAQSRRFRTFHVDLTHFDSPASESLRKQYGITGVPTIVFLAPDGHEIREARVEGFLPPRHFSQRMSQAVAASARGPSAP